MKNFRNNRNIGKKTWGVLGKIETYYSPEQFLDETKEVPLNANAFEAWDTKRSRYKRLDLIPIRQGGVVPQETTTTTTLPPTTTTTTTLPPTTTTTTTLPFDPDAQTYLNAVINDGGVVTQTIEDATDVLFKELKASGIYNKLYVLYPFLGGIANSSRRNAIDPNSFIISWSGGLQFSNNFGVKFNGSNTLGQTGFNPNVQNVPFNSLTLFTYITEDGVEGYDIGAGAAGILTGLATRRQDFYRGEITRNQTGNQLNASTTALGVHILSRTNNNDVQAVQNGGQVFTVNQPTTSTNSPNNQFMVGVFAGVGIYSDKSQSTTGIAQGLTVTEIEDLRDILINFNTSIGR